MMVLLMLAMLGCGLGDQPHSKTPHDVPAFFHSTVEVLAATKNLTRSPISPFARPDSFWMHPLPLVFPNSVVSKCPRISSHSRIVSTRCAALHLRRNEAGYLEQVRAERLSSQDRELMYPPGSRLTPKELCIPVLQWRLARTRMEAFDREPLRVMLLFGEHGRELVSSELALRFLGILSDLAKSCKSRNGIHSKFLWENVDLTIFPVVNPWGRQNAEFEDPCSRKNENGVDLNRNYDSHFNHGGGSSRLSETFSGRTPFSEAAAALVRQALEEFQPSVFINVHSGEEAAYTPFDHSADPPPPEILDVLTSMLSESLKEVCPNCKIGPAGKTSSYLAFGTGSDYAFEKGGVPASFTLEIFGEEDTGTPAQPLSPSNECRTAFNPMEEKLFQDTLDRWTKGILRLMEFANKEVSVSDAITDAHTGEAARSPLQQAPLEGQKLRTLLEEAKAVRAKAYEAPPSHFIMEVEKGWWQSTPHLFEWWISFESMVTPEWVEEIEAVHDEQQVEDLVALQEAHQGRFNANAIGGRGNVQARHMVILWILLVSSFSLLVFLAIQVVRSRRCPLSGSESPRFLSLWSLRTHSPQSTASRRGQSGRSRNSHHSRHHHQPHLQKRGSVVASPTLSRTTSTHLPPSLGTPSDPGSTDGVVNGSTFAGGLKAPSPPLMLESSTSLHRSPTMTGGGASLLFPVPTRMRASAKHQSSHTDNPGSP